MISFQVNDKSVSVDVPPGTPLLWVLRDGLGLSGTKFGCGIAECGACTVLVNGQPVRSCVTAVSEVAGAKVQTIEGLGTPENPHPLQKAWIDEDVVQCGYCQSGHLMEAAALLAAVPRPTDDDIDRVMGDRLCRCGTYPRIRAAIHLAARRMAEGGGK